MNFDAETAVINVNDTDATQVDRFERWLTEDVLPSIRRTGSYSLPQRHAPVLTEREKMRSNALQHHRVLMDMVKTTLDKMVSTGCNTSAYIMVKDVVWRALFDHSGTLAEFRDEHGIPDDMSITDVCDEDLLDVYSALLRTLELKMRMESRKVQVADADELNQWILSLYGWIRHFAGTFFGMHDPARSAKNVARSHLKVEAERLTNPTVTECDSEFLQPY